MTLISELDNLSHAGRHKTERVAGASMSTVGSLPGGGGSGGSPKSDLLQHPFPSRVGGLNSVMVYGENLQVATPLNHQLAVGSNLQICIDPAGLCAGVPGFPGGQLVSGLLGGGLGGNMQFTIGTSASVVLGREYDINFGPGKVDSVTANVLMVVTCGVIGGLTAVWPLIYDAIDDDTHRATLCVPFQIALDLLLAALMTEVAFAKAPENDYDDTYAKMFGSRWIYRDANLESEKHGIRHADKYWLPKSLEYIGIGAGAVGAVILPSVLVAANEKFDEATP